jgi:ATP-dependent HslUV protease subunit HslV
LDADMSDDEKRWRATTILMVRKGNRVVIGGDGQVSLGQTVMKSNARKVRRLGKGEVISGFAGASQRISVCIRTIPSRLNRWMWTSEALNDQFFPA